MSETAAKSLLEGDGYHPPAAGTYTKRQSLIAAIRSILIAGNFFFLILGSVVLFTGVSAASSSEVDALIDVPGIENLSYCLIVLGVLIITITVTGSSGLLAHKRGLILFSTVCLTLLIAVQFVIGIVGLVKRDMLPQLLDHAWTHTADYNKCSIQFHLSCCGFSSPVDRPCEASPCPTFENSTAVGGCESILVLTVGEALHDIGFAGLIVSVFELAGAISMVILYFYLRGNHGVGVSYQVRLDDISDTNVASGVASSHDARSKHGD